MGDHAPPLLAAMTITEAKSIRSLVVGTILRSSITMMIVVVMLSSSADMKKVSSATSHSRRTLRRVVMRRVMNSNPPWKSIRSTIVIAPIRKTRISHVDPRCRRIIVAHGRLGETGQGGGVFQTENTPKNTAHQQGDGRFIDSRFVFEGDEGIAYDKQDEHGCNHNYSIALNPFIYKRCFLHPEEPADNAVLLIENENFPSLFSAFGTIRAVSHPPVENGRKDCAPAGRTLDRRGRSIR